MKRTFLMALGVLAWSGATVAHAQVTNDLVGCYEVRAGEWSDAERHDRISGASLPDTIRLRSEASDRLIAGGRSALEPQDQFVRGRMGGAFWSAQGDSVRLTWTTDLSGLVVRAERQGDQLVGIVESFWDNVDGIAAPRAWFEATRIECVRD